MLKVLTVLILNKGYIIILLLFIVNVSAQQYKSGEVNMGIGGIVSIGLQDEVGLEIRTQFNTASQKSSYTLAYHRFFRKEFENTEVFNEFEIGYLRRVYSWEPLKFYVGFSYFLNNYPISELERNTSKLFINSGDYNHGFGLKAKSTYPLSDKINLFAELVVKSFGRRYDTFGGGISYRLGL
ncbi:hypothetical protein NBT05_00105 [Aquimarina sp. ERC-38]|uniref:hypothetical protein n=1 Tax=Aquimarina sp. ERC-38 TaxID=2949996 RepID=UPI002245C801|nr:hypothetical protein [Aquimarina sp. ERC-38]UZO80905.1 hypothetical protein NBT05_00105 [Aquimarina sp. ERC-38]